MLKSYEPKVVVQGDGTPCICKEPQCGLCSREEPCGCLPVTCACTCGHCACECGYCPECVNCPVEEEP